MLDVCLLGTGGMMPLPYRYLTSLLARLNGSSLLIDCGEGTQVALRKSGFSANPIDVICFTHFHGDHISGLPGLLLTMGNAERKEPLLLIGPKGLERVVNMLRVVAPELPFKIEFHEIEGPEEEISWKDYRIRAFRVQHNMTCYGYSLSVDRIGKFDAAEAKRKNIPLCFWNRLQHGETIEDGDHVYTPEMVLGESRKGLKVTYVTDTRPIQTICDEAFGSDLFICEGMYGEKEKWDHVKEFKHMMMQEAATLAKEAAVKELWLTHYSPAMTHPKDYQDEVKAIFENTVIAKDGELKVLNFEEA